MCWAAVLGACDPEVVGLEQRTSSWRDASGWLVMGAQLGAVDDRPQAPRFATVRRVAARCSAMGVCAVAGWAVMCAEAGAQVRPLAPTEFAESAPALAGERVVWARPTRGFGAFRLVSASRAGGPARRLRHLEAAPGDVELAGSADRVLLRREGSRGRDRLFAGTMAGPLREIGPRPLSVPEDAYQDRALWAIGDASVTLERTPRAPKRSRLVVRRPGGPVTVVRLGADIAAVDVAGGLAAVAVERDEKLGSGRVVRRVAAGPIGVVWAVGLAPDGSLAVSGGDRLALAAPADRMLGQVARGRFYQVALAAGRIAVVAPVGQPGGVGEGSARVVVLHPTARNRRSAVEFRGPPAAEVRDLQFDGAYATWASGGCQVVAGTTTRQSLRVLPRGPCMRTEIEATERSLRRRPGATKVRVRVGCLTTPTRTCRMQLVARAISTTSPKIGTVSARIPLGQARTVALTLTRRAERLVRRLKSRAYFEVRTVDPDGRSRLDDLLGV